MRINFENSATWYICGIHHIYSVIVLLLITSSVSGNSFLPSSRLSASGQYQVSLTSMRKEASIGDFHEWLLVIKEKNTGAAVQAERIEFSAAMPAHAHGLPSKPAFSHYDPSLGHIIKGVKFNMAGLWKLKVNFLVTQSGMTRADSAEVMVAIGSRVNSRNDETNSISWSRAERATLNSLALPVKNNAIDPTSSVASNKLASLWGRSLFFDAELSRTGSVSCSTCHQPDRYFTDGLAVAMGQQQLTRNTPTLVGSRYQTWFYWDGRRDSLWSQALVPMEAAAEMNNSRTRIVQLVKQKYKREYEALYGDFPALPDSQTDATPLGNDAQKRNWEQLDRVLRNNVNRVFSNTGKALAAYESLLLPAPGKFDLFVNLLNDDKQELAQDVFTLSEQKGLKLFISNRTQCLNCHNTPLLTNGGFHNIGTLKNRQGEIDYGRVFGMNTVLIEEFNCRSAYNDQAEPDCPHLDYLNPDGHDGKSYGAFKVPTLRGLNKSGPYMHDGRFATLEAVVDFYTSDEFPVTGPQSELPSIADFTATEKQQLTDFLKTLGSKLQTNPIWLRNPQ